MKHSGSLQESRLLHVQHSRIQGYPKPRFFIHISQLRKPPNYGTPELWIYVLEHVSAWMRRPETPGPHMSQHEDSMVIPRFMMQNDLRPLLFLSLAVNCQIDVVFFGRLAETRAGEFSGWRSRSQDIHFVVNGKSIHNVFRLLNKTNYSAPTQTQWNRIQLNSFLAIR